MDGVLLWTPGPSWRKGNFYKQWTTRRSWNCRWSAEGSDCTSFILLLPFDLIGCHFCPWNLKRLRLIISCNTFSFGSLSFFFFFEFFEGKRILLKDKNGWFHLMPRSMSAPKMPFPKTISLEPGLCSLDRNLIWKRIPDGARNEALSLNISFQPFEVGWVWTNFRATVLYFDIEKLVQTVGFQTSEVQTQVPVAFLLPSEGFLFRITAQICMICSNVGSRHPKNVAPMKDIDRFSCRTLRWNIVTHGPCVYNL